MISFAEKSIEHLDMSKRLPKHDQSYLEQVINDHISGEKPMASINSRSVLSKWTDGWENGQMNEQLEDEAMDGRMDGQTDDV